MCTCCVYTHMHMHTHAHIPQLCVHTPHAHTHTHSTHTHTCIQIPSVFHMHVHTPLTLSLDVCARIPEGLEQWIATLPLLAKLGLTGMQLCCLVIETGHSFQTDTPDPTWTGMEPGRGTWWTRAMASGVDEHRSQTKCPSPERTSLGKNKRQIERRKNSSWG